MPIRTDNTLLQMALVGYETERQKIQATIDMIKAQLGGRRGPATATVVTATPHTGRRMSAAARRKIAAAQKKRWATYRKKKNAA